MSRERSASASAFRSSLRLCPGCKGLGGKGSRKVDMRLPGNGNSNSHGAPLMSNRSGRDLQLSLGDGWAKISVSGGKIVGNVSEEINRLHLGEGGVNDRISTSERRGTNPKGFKDFDLKATIRIWP